MEPERILRIIDSYLDFFLVGMATVCVAGQLIRAFPAELSILGWILFGVSAIAFGLIGGFLPQSRPVLVAIIFPALLGSVFAWGV